MVGERDRGETGGDGGDRGRRGRSGAGGPPGEQALSRGIRPDGSLVEPQLQQEAIRLAHLAARADAERGLDLVAVELGTHGGELLLLGEHGDALLEVVVGEAETVGLAPVARGDVGAGQDVQSLELVAGVAHELNTPLGNGRIAITTLADKLTRFEKSLAEGLRRSELDAFIQGVQTSTDIAERNLLRASRLITSFKQVAADRTASRRRKFQLLEVVDEMVLTVSPSMKHRQIDVRVAIPDDIYLDSYPGELGQTLTNLIENCVAHAFAGRERGSIEITAGQEDEEVKLVLRDDGVGMAPEVARRVFDPFFTTSLGSGGTGLGLFIAHNAVTNVLGGSISLRSQPGEGARFDLRLPLVAPEVEVGQDAPCAAEPLARPGGSSR